MNNDNFQMYQNSGYKNPRNRKRTLILDIDDSAAAEQSMGSATEFNVQLFEPMIIDKQSEVYLDNFLTYNSNVASNISESAFCLKINEFKMNSNVASSSNNNTVFNSLVIPNEHKSVDNNHGVVVHKGKKFNYVCDINPQTIHSLSGKITDLSNSPIFHGPTSGEKFTYAIVGIDSGNITRLIESGEKFTQITSTTGTQTVKGTFLAIHYNNATELHFSTDATLTNTGDFDSGDGDLTFTTTATDPVVSNTGSENPNLHLINNPGRFIAEFSIISRE
jgi:hypothetical protein